MSGVISTIALTAVAATGVYSVIQNTKAQEAQQAANQTALDTQTKYQDASLVQQQEQLKQQQAQLDQQAAGLDTQKKTLDLQTQAYTQQQSQDKAVLGLQQQANAQAAVAQAAALAEAQKQAKNSEEMMNKANQRSPDVASVLQRAGKASAGGVGSTMLTGSAGINPSDLILGKTALLGA